jgi:hypothetical protein
VATERKIRKTVDFCVATMERFYEGRRMRHSDVVMNAEIQAHMAWIMEMNLGPDEIVEQILRPVEAKLISRYGNHVGRRLYMEFLNAVEAFEMSLPIAVRGEGNGQLERRNGEPF